MSIIRRTFRRNLQRRVKQLGLQPAEVSRRAGLSRQLVCEYMKGRSAPSIEKLEKLGKALQCEAADLIRGSKDMETTAEEEQ